MSFQFEDTVIQTEYEAYKKKISPKWVEIEKFCNEETEDNLISLKKRLLGYETFNNFLSYNYAKAMKFYKLALSQEWQKEDEFKGAEERKVRARVEARAIEPEAILQHFEKLIKGLSTSLTAIQTNLRVEEALLSRRME